MNATRRKFIKNVEAGTTLLTLTGLGPGLAALRYPLCVFLLISLTFCTHSKKKEHASISLGINYSDTVELQKK